MKKTKVEKDEFLLMLQQTWDSQKEQAGRRCLLADEQLYGYACGAVVDKRRVRAECRHKWWLMALIIVVTTMPIAVAAVVPAYRAEPLPAKYVQNPCPDRACTVMSINFMLQKL
jgi:hypothetical protein